MITSADLKSHTKSDLAKMAKRLGVTGISEMLKGDLVLAITKASRANESKSKNGQTPDKAKSKSAATRRSAQKSKTEANSPAKSVSKSSAKKPISKSVKKPAGKPAGKSVAKPTNKPAKKAAKKLPATTARGSAKPMGAAKPAADKAAPSTRAKGPSARAAKPGKEKATSEKLKPSSSSVPKKVVKEKKSSKPVRKPTNPKILKRIRELQLQRESDKDISFRPTLIKPPGASEAIWEREPQKDRVALFVRDPFWMHASWDITRNAIERAKAAMAEQWHASKPVLRLLRLDDSGTSSTSEIVERDVEIHGGLRNWYIDWTGEAASFRVMIGYATPNGRFHCICESNIVRTPAAGSADAVDEHWRDVGPESERIYAMSGGYSKEVDTADLKEMLEDRLHRTLGAPALARIGAGAENPFRRRSDFHFDMDIELVLYGSTVPDGYLTLNGEPVALREDGTFVMRLPFPDRRQVLPAVACTRDGSQQRTIVVAVERNTKIMEPLESEMDTGE